MKPIPIPSHHTIVLISILSALILSCSTPAPEIGLNDCPRTSDMPETLRKDHYRSPTPDCVPNATTLRIKDLQKLQAQSEKPILIDVFAILRRVDEGFGSTWLPNQDHFSLPKAIWLPNVGYYILKPDIEHYLQQNLKRLTQDNMNKPLVFFCVADCWMSWNVVQRVREYGYTRVYWYKDGTDGWDEMGLPLEKVTPVEME